MSVFKKFVFALVVFGASLGMADEKGVRFLEEIRRGKGVLNEQVGLFEDYLKGHGFKVTYASFTLEAPAAGAQADDYRQFHGSVVYKREIPVEGYLDPAREAVSIELEGSTQLDASGNPLHPFVRSTQTFQEYQAPRIPRGEGGTSSGGVR